MSSIGTSFSHNNGIEGEIVGSRPTRCVRNLLIKRKYNGHWLVSYFLSWKHVRGMEVQVVVMLSLA